MGNLVFQATLGGQVNLVGPNTASTYNLNVPAVVSTLATLEAQTFNGTQTYTVDSVINGLTVGRGAGAVSSNTAVGASSLASNTSGGDNTSVGSYSLNGNTTGYGNVAVGRYAMISNTTGYFNTAVGGGQYGNAQAALFSNTTGTYNVALGTQALYSNTVGSEKTAVGYSAGYSSTGNSNSFFGAYAGFGITSGVNNTLIGHGAGYYMTTGAKNTILGRYDGTQGGLNIATASNYIVLSDGDGNPRHYIDGTGAFTTTGSATQGSLLGAVYSTAYSLNVLQFASATTQGWNAAGCVISVGKNGGTSRSINAGGTVNVGGLDYAEYMTKAGDFTVAKGDIVGINAEGKLTNVFADAVSFAVKSTNPSYVGGDVWGVNLEDGSEEFEIARQKVDRIAFAGQVPVNVTGATAGQFIVPTNDNGAIKGEAISNPTFEQYQQAVGKVIAIEQDGRARIIVKVA